MDATFVVLIAVVCWALLSVGALVLASGIGAAAASADRNARHWVRLGTQPRNKPVVPRVRHRAVR